MSSDRNHALKEARNLIGKGQLKEALALVASYPENDEALDIAGTIFLRASQTEKAVACFSKAINLQPSKPQYRLNLAQAYRKKGDIKRAIDLALGVAKAAPKSPLAIQYLGELLQQAKRYREAAQCFQRLITLKPKHYSAHLNLSSCLLRIAHFQEAKRACEAALAQGFETAQIHNNYGSACMGMTQIDEAIIAFEKALKDEPDHDITVSNMANVIAHSCDWPAIRKHQQKAVDKVRHAIANGGSFTLRPFTALTIDLDPTEHRRITEHYVSKRIPKPAKRLWSPNKARNPKDRIRVGYLSSDVRNHPVFHLANNLFKRHDRDRFEVYCYSNGNDDQSDYRRHAMDTCDSFVDIRGMSGPQAAQRIFNDGIDLLVDMNGHTMADRMDVLCFKPAPLLFHFLGYPGTTGADFIDYFITDRYLTPPGSEAQFSEKLIFMPDTYQISDDEQTPSKIEIDRTEEGLPEDAFVFCSFNSSYKITEEIFTCWMKILNAVPDSVLWLLAASQTATSNLTRAAERQGIDSKRLIFAKQRPKPEHLARHRLADLFLDTSVVCGHTTANDALQMGLPVVAWPRESFISRVSATLLRAHDLEELICSGADAYVDLAIKLANDPDRLSSLAETLKTEGPKVPARQTKRFVQHLEQAYEHALSRYDAGDPPESLDLARSS